MTILSDTRTQTFRHNDYFYRRTEEASGNVTWEERHVDEDEFREVEDEKKFGKLERLT